MKLGKWTVGWNGMLAALLATSLLAACSDDDDDDDTGGDACTLSCDEDEELNEASCLCQPKGEECTRTCEDNETLDEEACECVPGECTLNCEDDEELNEEDCICEPILPGECGEPVDEAEMAGVAWVIEGDADTLGDTCAAPPTNPLICSQLPGLIGDAAFTIALYAETAGDGQINMLAGLLDGDGAQDGPAIEIPPVDFSANPEFSTLLENFQISISDLTLDIIELSLDGSVCADLETIEIAVFRLIIDPAGLSASIGIDLCTLGVCRPDGMLLLELHGITAQRAPGVVITAEGM